MQANHTETVGQEGLGDRTDDGVHARGRAAATEDNDGIFHDTYKMLILVSKIARKVT